MVSGVPRLSSQRRRLQAQGPLDVKVASEPGEGAGRPASEASVEAPGLHMSVELAAQSVPDEGGTGTGAKRRGVHREDRGEGHRPEVGVFST